MQKDRFSFYVNRAAALPNREWDEGKIHKYYQSILPELKVHPPPVKDTDELFDGMVLKRSIFESVLELVDPTSSPGYPFIHLSSTNKGFKQPGYNKEFLYATVVVLAYYVWFGDFDGLDPEGFIIRCLYPANVFVKREPTSISKIARLIYGTPLNFGIIMRIIFGDFLDDSILTYPYASHKVGMDMYTEEGVSVLVRSYKRMRASCPLTHNISSDVQGWEYSENIHMHRSWFNAYYAASTSGRTVPVPHDVFFTNALCNICSILSNPFISFDDGVLFHSDEYLVLSGVLLTHRKNSDTRAGLSRMVTGYPSMTNGDDCTENIPSSWTADDLIHKYHQLGFKITDVEFNSETQFSFSSQIFSVSSFKRVPLSLTKSIVNYSLTDNLVAREEIRWFVQTHPRYSEVSRLFDFIDTVFPLRGASDGIKLNE